MFKSNYFKNLYFKILSGVTSRRSCGHATVTQLNFASTVTVNKYIGATSAPIAHIETSQTAIANYSNSTAIALNLTAVSVVSINLTTIEVEEC